MTRQYVRHTEKAPQMQSPITTHPDTGPREDMRADQRPEMRSAEEIKSRAAAIFEQVDFEETVDAFAAPTAPQGISYEWKRMEVYGQPDPKNQVAVARTGWEAVPARRHPEMMPKGSDGPITRDGMMLMERPMEVTKYVEDIERKRAFGQVRDRERELGIAPIGPVDPDSRVTRVKRTYEAPSAGLRVPE